MADPYDQGGWLQPGTSAVENKSGRPERVLKPGESTADEPVVEVHAQPATASGGTAEPGDED
jgi:hypothetical protein